jgi:hypothetical protein
MVVYSSAPPPSSRPLESHLRVDVRTLVLHSSQWISKPASLPFLSSACWVITPTPLATGESADPTPTIVRAGDLRDLTSQISKTLHHYTPKCPLQCKRCQRFGHSQRNCGYVPRCVACVETHVSGDCSTPKQQLKCCSCGAITGPTTGAAASGKSQKWRLQSKCPSYTPGPAVLPSSPPGTKWSRHSHPPSSRTLDLVGTMLSEEVVLLRPPSQPPLNPLLGHSQRS